MWAGVSGLNPKCLKPKPGMAQVRVVRGGKERSISTYDLLVGDVLLIDTGDILPADGLLFESSNLRCGPQGAGRHAGCCRLAQGAERAGSAQGPASHRSRPSQSLSAPVQRLKSRGCSSDREPGPWRQSPAPGCDPAGLRHALVLFRRSRALGSSGHDI